MTDWRKITCAERDAVFYGDAELTPGATLTDLAGRFGEPTMFIEWWDKATQRPVLQDRRFPSLDGTRPDVRPCEHFVPAGDQS